MKSTESKRKINGQSASRVTVQNDRCAGTEDRQNHIATAAYYKAEARSFMPAQKTDDWLEAESELSKSAGF